MNREPTPLLPRPPAVPTVPEPDVQLLLRPLRDSVPAGQRLKRLVKAIGRAYRFRVLRCVDVGGEPGPLQRIAQGERHAPAETPDSPRAGAGERDAVGASEGDVQADAAPAEWAAVVSGRAERWC